MTSTPALDTTTVATPLGTLALFADGDTLVACGFSAEPEAFHARLRGGLSERPLRPLADLGKLSKAVSAYFEGDLTAIDDLPVTQPGTPLQQAVWQALREIPAGTTRTYGEIAARVGSPRAFRAIGSACGRNMVAPVVPCHRAVASGGGLGGYYYGLDTKRWLLAHEAGRLELGVLNR